MCTCIFFTHDVIYRWQQLSDFVQAVQKRLGMNKFVRSRNMRVSGVILPRAIWRYPRAINRTIALYISPYLYNGNFVDTMYATTSHGISVKQRNLAYTILRTCIIRILRNKINTYNTYGRIMLTVVTDNWHVLIMRTVRNCLPVMSTFH